MSLWQHNSTGLLFTRYHPLIWKVRTPPISFRQFRLCEHETCQQVGERFTTLPPLSDINYIRSPCLCKRIHRDTTPNSTSLDLNADDEHAKVSLENKVEFVSLSSSICKCSFASAIFFFDHLLSHRTVNTRSNTVSPPSRLSHSKIS